MKKALITLLTMFSIFTLTGCNNSSSEVNGLITLNSDEISVEKYDTYQLNASIEGITGVVSWSSDNNSIATVDQNGVVKGVSVGECLITAKVDKVKTTCRVHVTPCEENAILFSSVEEANIITHDEVSYDLYATYKGEVVENYNFNVGFFDDNPLDVALVTYADMKLTIVGLKAGHTEVTVYGNIKDTDLITTISINVSDI